MNDNKNALEPLADSLVEGFSLISTTVIKASANILVMSIKGAYEIVKLVADVGSIAYRVGTGTYDYEVATTEDKKIDFKSVVDIEYKEIKTKELELGNKFMDVGSFEDCQMPKMLKYKSCSKSDKLDLKAYIGMNEQGNIQEVDFYKDGSLLIGGASRWGKTSLIYSLLLSLLQRYDSNYLKIVLVDFKCVDLVRLDKYKNIVGSCITEVDKLNDMLSWIEKQCNDRAEVFRSLGVATIQEYNGADTDVKMQPILIVIDEIAQVLVGDKKVTDKLKDRIFKLVSKSMCFGIYWVVCTQELSRDTLGKMKINFTQSIGLKCADKTASDLIIKNGYLEDINIKGRAKIENSDGLVEFQSYWATKEDFEKLLKDKRK